MSQLNQVTDVLTTHNLHQTKWGKIIIQAARTGFTPNHSRKAASWISCACGQLDSRIPRCEIDGRPKDHKLADLGQLFFGWVEDNQPLEAALVLVRIEAREHELLTELGYLEK